VARGLLVRIGADVRLSLARLPAVPDRQQSSTAPTDPAAGTDPAAPPADPAATGTETTDPAAAPMEETGIVNGKFNLGVVGDQYRLDLFVSAVPRYGMMDAEFQTGASDLRRITYWLEPGAGLFRREIRNVTTVNMLGDEGQIDLLATEVVDLQFRYYNPTAGWVPSWDGTTMGPPLAVEIILGVQPPAQTSLLGTAAQPPVYYRMVVAIPGASIPQELVDQLTTGTAP
jgi:hypothetical protein